MKSLSICFFLVLATANTLLARHIIGGEMTYICNGNGGFTFNMSLYRDCDSTTDFDEFASIAIYRQSGDNYILFSSFDVSIRNTLRIPIPDDPCKDIPNLCVERGEYEFSRNLNSLTEGSYHIIYQRCCRNGSISNLIDPGSEGITITAVIPASATQSNSTCNDSPVFNDFPPIVICQGEDISFDHSASDADGDQLIYKFCAPLDGGGLLGSTDVPGDPSSCEGVIPDPACPPPHNDVRFSVPTYSATNPMGGSPQISINPSTGYISGIPQIVDQFVVGVCVDEFRAGELLSTIRRDFQFNVTTCAPVTFASIESDSVVIDEFANRVYYRSVCGTKDVNLVNTSLYPAGFEVSWDWDLDEDNVRDDITAVNPILNFPEFGTRTGTLVIGEDTNCADSALIVVSTSPAITADFTFDYDTCVPGPIFFQDESVSDAGEDAIEEWQWNIADLDTLQEQMFSYEFQQPGSFPIALTTIDVNQCANTIIKTIDYYPAPSLIVVEPSTFLGCQPADIFFNNLSNPIDSTYDIQWDFGDGTLSSQISPTHRYDSAGVYSISLFITSPLGCETNDTFSNYITVLASPQAGFTYSPTELTSLENEITLQDESKDAVSWNWQLGAFGFFEEQNPVYSFPDTGWVDLIQVVTHENGCTDTLIKKVDIIPLSRYFLPNAFSPNYDGVNDEFVGIGLYETISDFEMRIFNRAGQQIFFSNDPTVGWNGRFENVGKMSQIGVYVYAVQYREPRGALVNLKGFATLLR